MAVWKKYMKMNYANIQTINFVYHVVRNNVIMNGISARMTAGVHLNMNAGYVVLKK
jgi:hypothetical protein